MKHVVTELYFPKVAKLTCTCGWTRTMSGPAKKVKAASAVHRTPFETAGLAEAARETEEWEGQS